MREAVRRRFGVDARGLWLTERVWEPELAADLADAGVRYALVDDRHFLVTGFAAERLHAPFWTESDGRRLALFPIDERLRYLIPFRPPEETAGYLRELREAGHRLAVLADDGEKFGGWPGTKEWVYERGLARPVHGHDRRTGGAGRGAAQPARRGAGRGAEQRPRLPPDRLVPRDGELVAAARRGASPGPAGARPRRGAAGRARRRARPRRPLAQLPGEVLRVQPDAQEDAGALRALPPAGQSARGAPRHRPGAVQRRLLARRVRRPLPAAPARRDLAQAGRRRRPSCAGERDSRGRCWTSTATATRRSGSTPSRSRPW